MTEIKLTVELLEDWCVNIIKTRDFIARVDNEHSQIRALQLDTFANVIGCLIDAIENFAENNK
jgi:hypothetical protein